MAAKQYKDFNKEAKDLLTKNFPAAGSWKIEAKEKGGDRTFILSPVAELKPKGAALSVDVDYNIKEYRMKTKTNVSSTGVIKPKVTFEPVGHKVETTLMALSPDADFEIAYEGEVAGALVYDRVTRKGAEVQASYAYGQFAVGAGVNWGFQKGLDSWSAGVRYVDKRGTIVFTTKDLKKHFTYLYAPCPVGTVKATIGGLVECGHGVFNFQAVAEGVVCPSLDLKARVRVDKAGTVAISFIKKFVNGWTAAVAVESTDCTKFGVQLTRE